MEKMQFFEHLFCMQKKKGRKMALVIDIQKKPIENVKRRKINQTSDVFQLQEIQEIKDATQEHFFMLGLDSKNNITNINLIGVGTSKNVYISSKDIARTALINNSDKVIFVHNHPSGELIPSKDDIHLTNYTSQILKAFNIQLLDHVIVTSSNYASINIEKYKSMFEESDKALKMDKALLIEENNKLKEEVKILKRKLQKTKNQEEDFEF